MITYLVTGGSGFIGSHFIHYFLTHYEDAHIVNLDKLTYAHCHEHVSPLETHPRYTFIQGDICDKTLIPDLFNKHQFQGVFHFAAESHVDNSIDGPEIFIDTNIASSK